jgi:hypothetical protein
MAKKNIKEVNIKQELSSHSETKKYTLIRYRKAAYAYEQFSN